MKRIASFWRDAFRLLFDGFANVAFFLAVFVAATAFFAANFLAESAFRRTVCGIAFGALGADAVFSSFTRFIPV